jgi:hypothetical protein
VGSVKHFYSPECNSDQAHHTEHDRDQRASADHNANRVTLDVKTGEGIARPTPYDVRRPD